MSKNKILTYLRKFKRQQIISNFMTPDDYERLGNGVTGWYVNFNESDGSGHGRPYNDGEIVAFIEGVLAVGGLWS